MENSALLKKPIIFIGTGRSGTTIISEIVMRHPDLAYISSYQGRFIKFPSINLLRHFFENRWWKIVGQKEQLNKVGWLNKFSFKPAEAYGVWKYLTAKDKIDFPRDFLLDKEASKENVEFIRNYFHKLVKYQGRNRLVIKITGPTRIGYLLSIFPDAQFVHLYRREIPVISSFLKVNFWKNRGATQLWWRGAYTDEEIKWAEAYRDNSVMLTAFQIKKLKKVKEQEYQEHKPSFMEVSYEDFVADPKKELDRILNFLDLSKSEDCYSYLDHLKIFNRNKQDEDYFSEKELREIKNIRA